MVNGRKTKFWSLLLPGGMGQSGDNGLQLSWDTGGHQVSQEAAFLCSPPIIGPLVWKSDPALEGPACTHLPAWGRRKGTGELHPQL